MNYKNKYRQFFLEDCRVNGFYRNKLDRLRYLIYPPKTFTYLRLLRKLEELSSKPEQNVLNKLYKLLVNQKLKKLGLLLSYEIPPFVCGPGLRLPHYGGIIINSHSTIGKNFTIRPFSVIGNKKSGMTNSAPVIGNNVDVGCNCSIIGGIHIGNNVIIGAGSVVVSDIPDNSICIGNPAKFILLKS